ncbi:MULTISPECIES: nuclear transport factor 2 family protein [unclassified Bradyrhizobium]|uniref:nuclear transport factor 2 family protein n=1 Tax=unclassified Bradyrhizobium TaxID=2631580 RepID=UPI001AEEC54E|nr:MULTISPECIES: nuclear transport factor 2 family protein [unclassified Bradyrhizobium]
MHDIQTRREIESVLVEWSWLIDHGRAQDAAVLFTQDAEQSIAGVTASGIEAIAQGLKRRADMTGRTSRHVISNLRLSMSSDATVDVTWILTLYRSDDAGKPARPILVCDVQDSFRKEASGWKIRSRKVIPVFSD